MVRIIAFTSVMAAAFGEDNLTLSKILDVAPASSAPLTASFIRVSVFHSLCVVLHLLRLFSLS